MVASRQDAWTEDDDLVLAEVTLRHIREGGTQLAAFEEVGQRLGRTAAACGFRWNSTVRKRYDAAIAIAKGQRQQMKKLGRIGQVATAQADTEIAEEPVIFSPPKEHISTPDLDEEQQIETAIRLLTNQKETVRKLNQLEQLLQSKEMEIKELREENDRIKKELETVQDVSEDYKALLQIMERARKLVFLQEEEPAKPVFKMDENGNLERIEK
ncbi:RsfA family transcriptional regulator [Brevibacillus migulae]|uniref:RsfA family transcriptional regulator n=1 Tax=Brevibacillus migulae TaxID=1644114 RepID=UPI00106E11AD|nr:RsfA family transcriptional regulator [Brevibacillus migulae]